MTTEQIEKLSEINKNVSNQKGIINRISVVDASVIKASGYDMRMTCLRRIRLDNNLQELMTKDEVR